MTIRKSRISNAETYLRKVPRRARFKIVTFLEGDRSHTLHTLGFSHTPEPGETILPKPIGAVSHFNAEGDWQVFRDRPKERRYIRTVSWTWRQWAGRGRTEEKEGLRDIYRDCYARELVEPPAIEITYMIAPSQLVSIAAEFANIPEQSTNIRHAINLMLELFGACDIVQNDFSTYSSHVIRKVNWRMLPPGPSPWTTIREHVLATVGCSSEKTQKVILDRQDFIFGLGPTETYVGVGGFSDYLAYVFKYHGIVVLESIRKDNAIYVFGTDWQQTARMTKAAILQNNLQRARLIHADGWKMRLEALLRPRQAAE